MLPSGGGQRCDGTYLTTDGEARLALTYHEPLSIRLACESLFLQPGIAPAPGKNYASLISALMHPLSRGSVHIASADPLVSPAIVSILKKAQLFETESLPGHVKRLVCPAADVVARGKEGLGEYAREACGDVFHPVGTAAMVPREDGGVVDASLKVYGTSNLRIVSLLSLSAVRFHSTDYCPWPNTG